MGKAFQVHIQAIELPDQPRGIMARLRAHASRWDYALLESALCMPEQAQWSYIGGPAIATLYTATSGTHLRRGKAITQTWAQPFEALSGITAMYAPEQVEIQGHRPAGLDFLGGWMGVLSYDLVRHLERLPQQAQERPVLPLQWWLGIDQVLAFHHASQQWWQVTLHDTRETAFTPLRARQQQWQRTLEIAQGPLPQPQAWSTGPRQRCTDQATFERNVDDLRARIAAGEVLQVNLTRREEAAFAGDPWALYEALVAAHPAPFAAFLEAPDFALASCSPERFLQVRGRHIQARPMKGTAPRSADPVQDKLNREALAQSAKDRAENVMIVDLMRNDLGRVAVPGSVHVPALFSLEPYSSVWQMVSTVQAELAAGHGLADVLRACWPPGSMTGAPKVKAMEIIEQLEPVRRGFYAGSAGYMSCDGAMDLSVVIRSAVVAQAKVMLQFGGGIVADSQAAAEWAETLAKAQRLTQVLDSRGQ